MLLFGAVLGASLWGQTKLDPAAWGANHVGEPVPEYIDGEECLFCHRREIGATWQSNRHALTVRGFESDDLTLGAGERNYRLELLRPGKLALEGDPERFGQACAGCHASGVEPETGLFYSVGIDCFACHGDVSLEHSTDVTKVWLSSERRSDAAAVVSICAQCHLRGGRSASSGKPYPANFVAGDNLFQDFQVDWALADDADLNPGDRHVYWSARAVAVEGDERAGCLRCHDIHGNSSEKHRRVLRNELCFVCHERTQKLTAPAEYTAYSPVCEASVRGLNTLGGSVNAAR